MTNISREYLLDAKESVYFERKSIEITPSKLANSIIGMANAEGGVIVLGIKNGEIEDLKTLNNIKYNDFKQISINFIKPPCNFKIEEVMVEGKTIFLYHIEPNFERLYMKKTNNEEVYLRIGDENRPLNREEVRQLEYDKTIRKYEDETIDDFDEKDFDMDLVNHYKNDIIKYNGDYRDLFVNKYLAIEKNGKYLYKRATILLFAKDPEKYIASASVRYVRYNGTYIKTGVNLNIEKDQRFIGPIPKLVEKLKTFLNSVLKDYYFLDLYSGKFAKVPEYPEDAWLEGIVNALTHRSYNLQGNVILIKHYTDRFEISNSGPLPSFVNINNIEHKRYARNPKVARILAEFGLVRELNEGVKRIFEAMRKSFLAKPEYKEEDSMVYLTLKNNNMDDSRVLVEQKRLLIERELPNLNDTSKNIIMELSQSITGMNIEEISIKIGISERTIRDYVNKLIKLGIVKRHSEHIRDKNALYSL